MPQDKNDNYYDKHEKERYSHTKVIIESKASKKVIVAGPGTGKTFLFQKLIEKSDGRILTLSFINALVDSLSLELCGSSEVMTLHGFALKVLGNARRSAEPIVFAKLPQVISNDYNILKGEERDFSSLFNILFPNEDDLDFYKIRKNYYGRYYGFSDIVFAVVKYFEEDSARIPSHGLVLIDEFQDFNEVEVELINMLSEKGPIVIAGDDDQSLYGNLKQSSPEYLRERHSEDRDEYESHSLPYCSRCPEVIVNAINSLLIRATEEGLLDGRVEKEYNYFPSKIKDKVGEQHPKIVHAQRYSNSFASYISQQLRNIAKIERGDFSVLVIVPPQLKNSQLPSIHAGLKKKGYRRIERMDYPGDRDLSLLDGLQLLLEDINSNLGWRISASFFVDADVFSEMLKQTENDVDIKIKDSLDVETRKKIKQLRTSLRRVREGEEIEEEQLEDLFKHVNIEPLKEAAHSLQEKMSNAATGKFPATREVRNIPITLTTIPGSKGLAADYVFIMGMEDIHFGRQEPKEEDVYNLLVALTRAKKKAYVVSSSATLPKLLSWISGDSLDLNYL